MTSQEPPPHLASLDLVIRKFIPKELITKQPMEWQCDRDEQMANFTTLMDAGFTALGMFESAEDVWKHVAHYINFPNSAKYFNRELTFQDSPRPIIHKSLKKDDCIYRHDLPKIFEFRERKPFGVDKKLTDMAEAILKNCWKQLIGESHHEMIKCPQKPNSEALSAECSPFQLPFDKSISREEFDEFMNEWKTQSKKKINVMIDFIVQSMALYHKRFPELDTSYEDQANVISWVGFVMEKTAEFAKSGDIVLPPLHSPASKPKALIRLFSLGKNQFVMAHELLDTIKKHDMDVRKLEKEVLDMPELSTFSYNEVLQKVGKSACEKTLDFVEMKIESLMFVRTPIPTPKEGFCVLAVDALYELLMNMIVAKKVFQDIVDNDWLTIEKFLMAMMLHFDTSRYFMDSKVRDAIMTLWESVYRKTTKRTPVNIEWNSTKLDLEKLKETINKLKIGFISESLKVDASDTIFLRHAKSNRFKRSDLYIGVAHFQLNGLVMKLLKLYEFIHSQEACFSFGVQCIRCVEKKNGDEMPEETGNEKKQKSKGKTNRK
ncbi:hypothetical protein CRE_08756 [Caenorhabditis remanei]|uniref:Uncharacterized protein n=1 Tax=Caenorhabditis remanei TaxID=31234 RepID=E3LHC8_CAERE|nr:hypothetical protein CRE_08756 [Caenorhabditis remanei]